jgi:hypothetical protein
VTLASASRPARGGVQEQVLAAAQVGMEARLLDDRADARQRRLALGWKRPSQEAHLPRRRPRQPEQKADQRRLAGAVGPEEAEGAAGRHVQVDAVDGAALAEALAEAARLDDEGLGVRHGGGGHAAHHIGARRVIIPAWPSSSRRAGGRSARPATAPRPTTAARSAATGCTR